MNQNNYPSPLRPEPDAEAPASPLPYAGEGGPQGREREDSIVDDDALSPNPSPASRGGELVASPEESAAPNDELAADGISVAIAKQAIEAALLSADEPLQPADLRRMFEPDIGAELVGRLLADIQQDWLGRSVELKRLASGWRFQTSEALQPYLMRIKQNRTPRYSRAVLETLAIIVYRQPVTRGDIEEIRGVAVSTNIIKLLETRGWIDTIGHRDTPGRPALYATTRKFLDDLGLRSLTELPPLSSLSDIEGVLDLVDTAEAASPDASGPEHG